MILVCSFTPRRTFRILRCDCSSDSTRVMTIPGTASPLPSGRLADGAVGRRGCDHGLLDQAGEAMADALGGAAVEAEDVLVQVPLQVLRADGAVMGAEQPAFGEGEHEVDRGQPERRVTPGLGEIDRLVVVALGGEAVVAPPAVGRDLGRAADVAAEEALEARGPGVGHRLQAQPAEPPPLALAAPALDRAGGDRLAGRPAPGLAGLGAADQGLVGLHAPAERLAISRHHGAADLVQPSPGGPVAADPHLPLRLHGGDAALARGDEIDGEEPACQAGLGLLEDRPGQERVLLAAGHALVDQTLLVTIGVGMATACATEAVRPARLEKIVPTLLVCAEPRLEARQVGR